MSLSTSASSSVFNAFVDDFMRLNHNPVDESLKEQSKTERLLDRWHGLVLKKGNSQEDGLNSVEDRIQRNIYRHEQTLKWLATMEQHLHHDAVEYANACASIPRSKPVPSVVHESETILKQIETLLTEHRRHEASFALDLPSAALAKPLSMA